MLCPVCHGKHVVPIDGKLLPCPECGGWGEIHCCDGLREQAASGDGSEESGDRSQQSEEDEEEEEE